MLRVGREIATEIGTDAQGRAQAWAPLLDAAVRDARFNETLLAHSRPLFAAVVRPTYYGAIPTMAPPTMAPPTMGYTHCGSTYYGSTYYGSTYYGSTYCGSTYCGSTYYGSTY